MLDPRARCDDHHDSGAVGDRPRRAGHRRRTTPPKTPWGEPDLQGIWSGETLTPLERPARFADKPVLHALERRRRSKRTWRRARDGTTGRSGARNVTSRRPTTSTGWRRRRGWPTGGHRSSSIPRMGRFPPMTPEAQARDGGRCASTSRRCSRARPAAGPARSRRAARSRRRSTTLRA